MIIKYSIILLKIQILMNFFFKLFSIYFVGAPGIEPGSAESKSAAMNHYAIPQFLIWLNCKFITLLATHLPETLYLSYKLFPHSYQYARREGFEPPMRLCHTVLETVLFDHSSTDANYIFQRSYIV